MAEQQIVALSMTQNIEVRSATITKYYERNKRRISQAGSKFLELSETAKPRDDWKGRLELWKQDTLLIANESVDKLNVQLEKLGHEKFDVSTGESRLTMDIAHPFMRSIKDVIEKVDAVMCQIQLQWVSGHVDDFIYEQASNQSINALNKIISRFIYLSDESSKRNKGLFSPNGFERMLSKEIREQLNPKSQKPVKAVKQKEEVKKEVEAATKKEDKASAARKSKAA